MIRLPAFVDAHVHLSQTGLRLTGLDLAECRNKADLLRALETYARTTDTPMILGFGWDESGWSDPALPTLAELDRAAPGRPVQLSRVDGHSSLVNSALVDRAPHLTTATGWDGSGRVEREANHRARDAVQALLTRSQRKAAIAAALDAAAAVGIGSVHEMSAPHINDPDDIRLIRELADERDQIEVIPYWGEHAASGGVGHAIELGCAGAAGDLNIDGAFGSRTAALTEPYADAPHRGHLYLDAEAVAEHVLACTRAGIQAGFHCIGDRATAAAAEGFRLAAKAVGAETLRPLHHRLEHAELLDPDDLAILRECHVVLSVQPAFDRLWGGEAGMYAQRLGPERALRTNPFAPVMPGEQMPLAFGSDSPVTPFDPWGAVAAAIHHHNPEFRLTPHLAMVAHETGGRWAARQRSTAETYTEWEYDGEVGPDGRPVDLSPEGPFPRCVRTVVNGRTVYSADPDDDRPREER